MRVVMVLERETPWERYDGPIVPVEAVNHRPRKNFKVVLRGVPDVVKGIGLGLPMILVQSEDLRILQYPLEMPPTLIVPRGFESVVETRMRVHAFKSWTPFERRRMEDMAVFLLSYDLIAARAVIERNLDLFDLGYIRKRVFQEDLEEQATAIRLQEFMDLPFVGSPMPKRGLMRAVKGNRVSGVVP